jgi:hypothetical protein
MTLQERLKELGEEYWSDIEHSDGTHDTTLQLATQAIEKDILELIGSELQTADDPKNHNYFINQYKSELRLKLKEWTRGKQ